MVGLDIPDHLVHARRIQEAARRLRMRVGSERRPLQRQKAGDLVLLPLLSMDALALPAGPRLQPPAVQRDGRHLGRRLLRRLPPVMHVVLRVPVTVRLHLRADLFGQAVDLPAADGDVAHQLHDLGGHLMRFHVPGRADDLVQQRRAIAVGVELQQQTLREKNPDGRSGSSTPVRGAQRCHRTRR